MFHWIAIELTSGSSWQNTALLNELAASPSEAAEVIQRIGRVSKKVHNSGVNYRSGLATESDVSSAIATSIGRVTDSAGNGYSLVKNLTQLKQLATDMETLVNVPAEQLKKSISLIRRLRSDTVKTALGGQSGYLFEITEVAHELRSSVSTVRIDFSVPQPGKAYAGRNWNKTDVDMTIDSQAVELKTTVGATGTKREFVEKLMKYAASGASVIEIRTLDPKMRTYVDNLLSSESLAESMGLKLTVFSALQSKISINEVGIKYNHPGIPLAPSV